MTRIIFIRHGNSVGNRDRRFCGHTDVALTELGLKQARLAAEFLRGERIDAAYSSDLVRAYETGRIVCESHGILPKRDSELREVDGGLWEGLIYEKIAERYPADNAMWNEDILRQHRTIHGCALTAA